METAAMKLNHTIVNCSNQSKSSSFLVEILGRPAATRFGPFHVVSLDYLQTDKPIEQQHYAFLITESEFDAVLGRITECGVTHWADPARKRAGEISRNDGGRGVYFKRSRWPSPRGHHRDLWRIAECVGPKLDDVN
jgi:catechol 2,3-dioxygenase-like lactoylglutathione lyase family enzyme